MNRVLLKVCRFVETINILILQSIVSMSIFFMSSVNRIDENHNDFFYNNMNDDMNIQFQYMFVLYIFQ